MVSNCFCGFHSVFVVSCLSLFLSTPSSHSNCVFVWPIGFQANSRHHRGNDGCRWPPPSSLMAKLGLCHPLFYITYIGSASLIKPWLIQNYVLITSQRHYNQLNLVFVDWTEDQVLTAYWLKGWIMSKKLKWPLEVHRNMYSLAWKTSPGWLWPSILTLKYPAYSSNRKHLCKCPSIYLFNQLCIVFLSVLCITLQLDSNTHCVWFKKIAEAFSFLPPEPLSQSPFTFILFLKLQTLSSEDLKKSLPLGPLDFTSTHIRPDIWSSVLLVDFGFAWSFRPCHLPWSWLELAAPAPTKVTVCVWLPGWCFPVRRRIGDIQTPLPRACNLVGEVSYTQNTKYASKKFGKKHNPFNPTQGHQESLPGLGDLWRDW